MKGTPPDSVRKALGKIIPCGADLNYRLLKTPKGLGSLGRRRYLAIFEWEGAHMAREAKSVAPSAYLWAIGEGKNAGKGNRWLEKTVEDAIRCADPYYEVRGNWLVRRLGPDCSRIDVEELVHHEDLASLLFCMGQETANIHLGTPKARKKIREAWAHLPKDWLEVAAHKMFKLCLQDWRHFKLAAR
jgi:hypothetical protein